MYARTRNENYGINDLAKRRPAKVVILADPVALYDERSKQIFLQGGVHQIVEEDFVDPNWDNA